MTKVGRSWVLFIVIGLMGSSGRQARAQDAVPPPPAPATESTTETSSMVPEFDESHYALPSPWLGIVQPSDRCFSNFISPITNPVQFEDPRHTTEARIIFLNNWIPNGLGGEQFQLYGMQLRAKLTERLSFIANKDGFIVSQSPLLDDGWADVSLGLKYSLLQDYETQQMLTVGATYAPPWGSTRALQGRGDGDFNLFATYGTQVGDCWHFLTSSGFRLPANTAQGTQLWFWSNHLDRQLGNSGWYLLGEANWYHWMSSGRNFAVDVEGTDLVNLGSPGVAGNDIVTAALGVKYKPTPLMEIGAAFEIPLTRREDLLDERLTIDWIIRY